MWLRLGDLAMEQVIARGDAPVLALLLIMKRAATIIILTGPFAYVALIELSAGNPGKRL